MPSYLFLKKRRLTGEARSSALRGVRAFKARCGGTCDYPGPKRKEIRPTCASDFLRELLDNGVAPGGIPGTCALLTAWGVRRTPRSREEAALREEY